MRRIVQISDLHFGNNDPLLLAPLRNAIEQIEPHVVVISGDLVEHASRDEFVQAKRFLDTLPKPQIVVPGNHDLPFYNLAARALLGLSYYRSIITTDLSPDYEDDELAIFGANTSRVWPIRGGSLSSLQLEYLARRFATVPEERVRLLVTHHPFDLPDAQGRRLLVGHARRSIQRLAPIVDILLAGHIHLSSSGSTATHYKTAGHAMTFVQAGTACSNRDKGEKNSFNALHISSSPEKAKSVGVERFSWNKEAGVFESKNCTEFRLESEGWAQRKARVPADAAVQEELGVTQR
jgi:3',5'-cyclic AMP phosphodiesterase CpdA